jgi:ferric-dicitrate binding protein FerR (iron transport regulator)
MTSGADDRGDDDLRRLIRLTRDALGDEALSPDEPGLLRLRAERGAPRRGPRLRWPVAGLVALGVAGGALAASRLTRRAAPLDFEIVEGASARIQFSDGTAIALPDGTRAHVGDVDARGGRVVLERGRARATVVARPRARWQIAAGPYAIETASADVDVDWSDTARALQLWVRGGMVSVSGPIIGSGMVLAAGQHLGTRLDEDKILLDAWDPAASRLEGGPPGH